VRAVIGVSDVGISTHLSSGDYTPIQSDHDHMTAASGCGHQALDG